MECDSLCLKLYFYLLIVPLTRWCHAGAPPRKLLVEWSFTPVITFWVWCLFCPFLLPNVYFIVKQWRRTGVKIHSWNLLGLTQNYRRHLPKVPHWIQNNVVGTNTFYHSTWTSYNKFKRIVFQIYSFVKYDSRLSGSFRSYWKFWEALWKAGL